MADHIPGCPHRLMMDASSASRVAASARAASSAAGPARREAARVIARCTDPRYRQLLIPLMHDADASVAREAVEDPREVLGVAVGEVATMGKPHGKDSVTHIENCKINR